MNLEVTRNCGQFQWLLIYFNLPVFKQTFLFNFIIIILESGRAGKQTRQFSVKQAAIVSLPLLAPNNANACWGHLKLNPWLITGFIDAECNFIVFIVENKKFQDGLLVLVYFSIALHKNILILRYTIVVLPNAFRGLTEAPQLPPQNSILPLPTRNYSTLATPRRSASLITPSLFKLVNYE